MASEEFLIFLNKGYERIVDIDSEKFFDNVPQDRLMPRSSVMAMRVSALGSLFNRVIV